MVLFYVSINLFNILLGRRGTLVSVSVFSLLGYIVLVEAYEENLASHR